MPETDDTNIDDDASLDDEIMETQRVLSELQRKLAFATHILDAALQASQRREHLCQPLSLPHCPPAVMIMGGKGTGWGGWFECCQKPCWGAVLQSVAHGSVYLKWVVEYGIIRSGCSESKEP